MSANFTWDAHYLRENSVLIYPDECLVRMAAPFLKTVDCGRIAALDLGCGTGRHLRYLRESGAGFVTGLDFSHNALRVCRDLYALPLVRAHNTSLPFRDSSFDMVVAWGSLHYSGKDGTTAMLSELKRITAHGGVLFATLRRDNDTYLKTGTHLGNNVWRTGLDDLHGSTVSFYSEDEVKDIFSGFGGLKYGFMERSIVGDTTKVISHWVISARR